MPRTPTDYSKTVIYSISHKEIEGLDYVGSTTDFSCRKGTHKRTCNNPKSTNHHLKLYETIRSHGGWEMFQMLEVKKFPCGDKREAEAEEEKCRQELKATLNMKRAFVSEEQRKEYNQQFYERHKDQIVEYKKQHYELHKDHISEKHKHYYEQHKDQIIERQKQYYEHHKDKIKEKKAMTYTCECCQSSLRFEDKARHERTKKHLKNAQNILK